MRYFEAQPAVVLARLRELATMLREIESELYHMHKAAVRSTSALDPHVSALYQQAEQAYHTRAALDICLLWMCPGRDVTLDAFPPLPPSIAALSALSDEEQLALAQLQQGLYDTLIWQAKMVGHPLDGPVESWAKSLQQTELKRDALNALIVAAARQR